MEVEEEEKKTKKNKEEEDEREKEKSQNLFLEKIFFSFRGWQHDCMIEIQLRLRLCTGG